MDPFLRPSSRLPSYTDTLKMSSKNMIYVRFPEFIHLGCIFGIIAWLFSSTDTPKMDSKAIIFGTFLKFTSPGTSTVCSQRTNNEDLGTTFHGNRYFLIICDISWNHNHIWRHSSTCWYNVCTQCAQMMKTQVEAIIICFNISCLELSRDQFYVFCSHHCSRFANVTSWVGIWGPAQR